MYSTYYEWNVHNTTDPRKLIYQEDPALQPKKEEPVEETTTDTSDTTTSTSTGTPAASTSMPTITVIQSGAGVGKSYSEKCRMCGVSGPAPAKTPVNKSITSNVTVKTRDKNGNTKNVSIPLNNALHTDFKAIMEEIFNKTSFRCYSLIGAGSRSDNGSWHPWGMAVDFNPHHGCPYFIECTNNRKGGLTPSGTNMAMKESDIKYVDGHYQWQRKDKLYTAKVKSSYTIPTYNRNNCIWSWDHPVVKIFLAHGWGWGGNFGDSMHFSFVTGN